MPSVFKAWVDQISIPGRTTHVYPDGAPATGRRAVVISARGGSYGPGTPNDGQDHLRPTLELAAGPRTLGLDITGYITPEWTLAPVTPQFVDYIPKHEESLAAAHAAARELGAALSAH
ncbi:NAD(P)H-dependent oxidoreductase [Cryobacterium sp. TMT4-31]|uniref:NAD(P)H-dependent oxidoreductase n=1 Tax=Cryobacterium sp. TMT4-31 TaxID=1259259 RepID=UPI001F54767E|nr:NAD(P)H-dependent oxidoreductase [Cryobacterium sp. TMT4-31]